MIAACWSRWSQPATATTNNSVNGWIGVLITEDSSFHCQPSLDTSHPKRPGAPVLSSFVFLDTTGKGVTFPS